MMTLPLHLEKEYQRLSRSVFSDLTTSLLLARPHAHRFDATEAEKAAEASNDALPAGLVALLATLGLRAKDLVNENRLRRKLRSLAKRLTTRQRAQLSRVLQRPIPMPTSKTIDVWVEEQVLALRSRVQSFANKVEEIARTPDLPFHELTSRLNRVGLVEATTASFFASSAVLALSTLVTQEMSVTTGSTHYRWNTTLDEVTRDWHADLDGTVQAWNAPPMGGGTSASYPGHPGEGINCRCIAQPL